MDPPASVNIAGSLQAWAGGEQAALDNLIPAAYAELRLMAHRYVWQECEAKSAGRIVPIFSPLLRS
jgi:hypothetical protein